MIVAYRHIKKKRHERRLRNASADGIASGAAEGGPAEGDIGATSSSETPPAKTAEEKAEEKRRRVYRWKVVGGLVAPYALQALDLTIVASALPFIALEFNEVAQLNWIISVFNLTSAAFLPFWAQMIDIFGRFPVVLSTIGLIAVGSAISTGAPTDAFPVLLLGRALQGVGAAGVDISVRTILADRVSLADFSLNWTLFAVLSAISFSLGPVIGGYLTQVSWRWCFGINLPVAAVAVVLVVVLLRNELLGPQPLPVLEGREPLDDSRRSRFVQRLATVDYLGQFLFLLGLGLLILALTWAGGAYQWDSAYVLGPLIVGAVLAVIWLVYEYLMAPKHAMSRVFPTQRAMIPWEVLSQRDTLLLFFIFICIGMSMFSVIYFMDLYFSLVEGDSPSKAGVALLFYLPGLGTGAYMAMFGSNVWPRQTLPSLMLGATTAAVGVTVLPWAIKAGNRSVMYGMMALVGHGVGMRMNPGTLHGLAYFPTLTAPITVLFAFAMPFGGTVSLTLMSTVFNNKGGETTEQARDGIFWAYVAMIPFMWVCLVLTTFLGNAWLGKDGSHEVVDGAYIWNSLLRRKLTRERRVRGEFAAHKSQGPENTALENEKQNHGADAPKIAEELP